jgi:hypothetical protein
MQHLAAAACSAKQDITGTSPRQAAQAGVILWVLALWTGHTLQKQRETFEKNMPTHSGLSASS